MIEDLEKLRRKFLWGGDDSRKKIHWVSWPKIIMDKKRRRFGRWVLNGTKPGTSHKVVLETQNRAKELMKRIYRVHS